jgi:hypothetical protein
MESVKDESKAKSSLFNQSFLDLLDKPANVEKAKLHGRCQKSYKILTENLDGK